MSTPSPGSIAPLSPLECLSAATAALEAVKALPVEHQVAALKAAASVAEAAADARQKLFVLGTLTNKLGGR